MCISFEKQLSTTFNYNEEYKNNTQEKEPTKNSLGSVGNNTPIIDWKIFLQRQKRKVFSADYNLYKGEFDEDGIYKYPYEVIRKANIEILIDTSGSVDDELVKAFLRECKNIFDDYIIEDLDDFTIEGRGGTNFSIAINSFSKKASIKIIFTDGYAEMPKNSSDVIWVVYSDSKINPPGGKVFYVDPNTITLKGKSR